MRKLQRPYLRLCCIAAGLLGSLNVAALPITLGTGQMTIEADDSFGLSEISTTTPSFGLSATDTVVDGSASATTTYNITNTMSEAVFDFSATSLAYGGGDTKVEAEAAINFTISSAVDYVVSGAFSGSSTTFGDLMHMIVGVGGYQEQDRSIGGPLLPPTSLTSTFNDIAEGDAPGIQQGSRIGTLGPGSYLFSYSMLMHDDPQMSVGSGSGTGSVRLTLTAVSVPEPPVPVPEPSTLALLGAGLLGLFMRRKRVA